MHFAVNYRLKVDQTEHDHALLADVYEELGKLQPPWLACESYRLDQHSMMFLIDLEDVGWLVHAPLLAAYLDDLAGRCDGEPRAGVVDRRGVDITGAHELGRWDPVRPG